MKVAVCFFGLHPDETWKGQKIKKDKCFELWQKNVFNINDCDIFMHSFSKKQNELLKYNPKEYLFEKEENSDIDFEEINKIEEQNKQKKKYNGWNLSKTKINYYISYGMKRTIELMSNYELKNNIKYDLVLLSRIDICWLIPINFNELNTNKIYSAIWGKDNIHSETGLLGYWLISNSNNMKKIGTFYDNQKIYNKSGKSYHKILKRHILSISDEIEYKYNDLDNDIKHMGLQRYCN